MKKIKEVLFGVRVKGEIPKSTTHTINIKKPLFENWCEEYRVSLVYGKKPIHIP